jgi:ABC-type transport system involved in multi-copper enzyme maturation permease subunit
MKLFEYELLKIFQQMSYYLIAALLLVFAFFLIRAIPEIDQNAYKPYEGKVTHEKINLANKEDVVLSHKNYLSNFEQDKKQVIGNYLFDHNTHVENQIKIKNLSKQHTNVAKLELFLLRKIDYGSFYNNQGPTQTIDFINSLGAWFTGILIIVGLSTNFTGEYTSGADQFIFATKLGRISIVTAKLMASFIYTFLVVLVWFVFVLAGVYCKLGNSGWQSPIQFDVFFSSSILPLNMVEFLILCIVIHLIGALGFTILVLFISSLCNTPILSLLISAILLSAPAVLSKFHSTLDNIIIFSYTNIMETKTLFEKKDVYNVLGLPIILPIIIISVSIIVTLILAWLTFRFIKEREVTI